MTVALFAEFTARVASETAVTRLVEEFAIRVRSEPGNLAFEPSRFRDEPRRWFVYEVYRDDAAFQEHIGADYGVAFNAALNPHIEERASRLTWLTPVQR